MMDLFTIIPIIRIAVVATGVYYLVDVALPAWIEGAAPLPPPATTLLSLLVAFVLNYNLAIFGYYQDRMNQRRGENELPPKCPEVLPLFGNALYSLWDRRAFLQQVGYHQGKLVTARLGLLWNELYLFQDRETIKKLAQEPGISTPTTWHTHAWAEPPKASPSLVSLSRQNALPRPRNLHLAYATALTGQVGETTTSLFVSSLLYKLSVSVCSHPQWSLISDFGGFFQSAVSAASAEALFGAGMVEHIPGFSDSLRHLSLMTSPLESSASRQIKSSLYDQVRTWHALCQEDLDKASETEGAQGCSRFGAMKLRHAALRKVGIEGGDLVAVDVALATALSNSMGSIALMMIVHIFTDVGVRQRLLCEIRESGEEILDSAKTPLLSSVLAETLRLGANSLLAFQPTDSDVSLGEWRFPVGKLGVLDTRLLHMDEGFWNTMDRQHPINKFWADRFMKYPGNPASGPVRSQCRRGRQGDPKLSQDREDKPTFSSEGLEGAWLPYGAGPCSCPGRHLANNIILRSCSVFVQEFDLEVLSGPEALSVQGLFPAKLDGPVSVRIRRTRVETA